MKRRKLTPYLFLLPGCFILGIVIFYPMLRAIWLSFMDYNMLSDPVYVGLDNYKELFQDGLFWQTTLNSFIYLVIAVPSLVILPIFLAILINQNVKGINAFRSIYYVPFITSIVVVGITWEWVYKENGFLNFMLEQLGFTDDPVKWLTTSSTALFAVIVVTIWKSLPFYMIIYLGGLQSIPSDLYEASKIDGANWWKQTIHVTIPQLKPYVFLVAVLSSINSLKVFEEIYVMTDGGPLHSSETLVFYIYREAFDNLNMGYASAAGVILFLLTLIFSLINMKFLGKDNTE
ncbi:MAG TPA: sugar ABC transporter permease [Virgibacillus sp.]|nr:sugar ABC transporter permease [Virgibacillus sp.]HLR68414.1 sugar ABC transporter permease [Virgibacillus sp.]